MKCEILEIVSSTMTTHLTIIFLFCEFLVKNKITIIPHPPYLPN